MVVIIYGQVKNNIREELKSCSIIIKKSMEQFRAARKKEREKRLAAREQRRNN